MFPIPVELMKDIFYKQGIDSLIALKEKGGLDFLKDEDFLQRVSLVNYLPYANSLEELKAYQELDTNERFEVAVKKGYLI